MSLNIPQVYIHTVVVDGLVTPRPDVSIVLKQVTGMESTSVNHQCVVMKMSAFTILSFFVNSVFITIDKEGKSHLFRRSLWDFTDGPKYQSIFGYRQ